LGIGDWAQSPIPNPQSPIPNPQSPFMILIKIKDYNNYINKYLFIFSIFFKQINNNNFAIYEFIEIKFKQEDSINQRMRC
jgi:hypothetical protein